MAPIWLPDGLPMPDSGAHLHMVALLHDWDISALVRNRHIQADVLVPGTAWYHAVELLAWVGGVEWAGRVVVSLSVGLLPAAALMLLRTLRQSRWLVLAIIPWALNAGFFAGDLPYLAGLPLFLWLLAAHVRLVERATFQRALLVLALMLALAATHHVLWIAALVLLPVQAAVVGAREGWRLGLMWPARELAICLPSIGLLVPWLLAQVAAARLPLVSHTPALVEPMGAATERVYVAAHLTPLASIRQLFEHMFARFSEASGEVGGLPHFLLQRPGELASSLWLLGLVLWILAIWYGPAVAASRGRVYAGSALVTLLALYFLLPQHLWRPLPLAAMSPRLVPLVAIVGVACLPLWPLAGRPHRRALSWAGSLALLICAVTLPLQTAGASMVASAEQGSMRAAYGQIPAERNVLTLTSPNSSAWLKGPVWRDPASWYAVYQGGYTPTDFGRLGPIPLAENPHTAIPRPPDAARAAFSIREHGRYYNYVVIQRRHGEAPGAWERSLRGWHRIYQRDRWQVFQNPQPAEWPIPTAEELARRARAERIVELLLEWIGMGLPDDRRIDARAFMGVLGIDLPEPPPPEPDPEVPAPESATVAVPGLEGLRAPDPVMMIPNVDFLPAHVTVDVMPTIAPNALIQTQRPLLGPDAPADPPGRPMR